MKKQMVAALAVGLMMLMSVSAFAVEPAVGADTSTLVVCSETAPCGRTDCLRDGSGCGSRGTGAGHCGGRGRGVGGMRLRDGSCHAAS